MAVIPIDGLDPDGVHIVVLWDDMRVGQSVFIPCINSTACLRQVRAVFGRRGWEMTTRIGAEGSIWGVRIWRTT